MTPKSSKFAVFILFLSYFVSLFSCSSFPGKLKLRRQTNSPQSHKSLLEHVKTNKFVSAWNKYLAGSETPLMNLIELEKFDPEILVDGEHNLMQAAILKGDNDLVRIILIKSSLRNESTRTESAPTESFEAEYKAPVKFEPIREPEIEPSSEISFFSSHSIPFPSPRGEAKKLGRKGRK